MFENLQIFRLSGAMAAHAGQRQAVVATNLANSDTPGYRAQRIGAFAETYRGGAETTLRASRPGHLGAGPPLSRSRPEDAGGEASPNGNAVSVEAEMLASVDAAREHARALAIYRHGMTVIRMSLGR
jgi:flagellar basal-body rod protein FlgB